MPWASDDFPGKVMLTNTLDTDHDGLPGYADGLNMFDVETIDVDDAGGHNMLVPLVVDVNGPVCPEMMIQFTYGAARPPVGLADPLAGLERPYEDHERLRLWRTRSPSRDPRSILDGGDSIPPGVWIPLERFGLVEIDSAGVARPAPDVTLWVEAVMPSREVGDAPVQARLSRGIAGSMQAHDGVRVTATEVVLLGTSADGVQRSVNALVRSIVPQDGVVVLEQQPLSPWMVHEIHIIDPRTSSKVEYVTVGTDTLSLLQESDGRYRTNRFLVFNPFESAGVIPSHLHGVIVSTEQAQIGCSYNPQWMFSIAMQQPERPPPPPVNMLEQIQKAADEISLDMKSSQWQPSNHNNGGSEFGNEVHRRMTTRFEGHPSIKCGMIVDQQTGIVRELEGFDRGVVGKVQLDCVVLERGYVPQVGQPLDTSRCWYIDIKTSVRGDRLQGDQRLRVLELFDRRRVQLLRPKWKWDQTLRKFFVNPKWGVAARVLPQAGLASGIIVAIHPDTANAMIEDIIEAHGDIISARTHNDLVMAQQELYDSICKWTDTFSGGDFGKVVIYSRMIKAFSGDLTEEYEEE